MNSPGTSDPASFPVHIHDGWRRKTDPERKGIAGRWFQDPAGVPGWLPVTLRRYWEGYPGSAPDGGWTWYAREVELKEVPSAVFLYLGAADDEVSLWINNKQTEVVRGMSGSCEANLAGLLRPGKNSLMLCVLDSTCGGDMYGPVVLTTEQALRTMVPGKAAGRAARRSPGWVTDAVIYSVYLRSFSPGGNFEGLRRRLPELHDLGVTVLWLLPIHPVGIAHRKGRLGSPYAVRDYYGVNPEFGTMDDFRRLVEDIHAAGMRVIIDLVANHASWDSVVMEDHPEWFKRDGRGSILSPHPDWTDVAQLDYSRGDLRAFMIRMMTWWVKDAGIDGFRCDVAERVPIDFWEDARSELDSIRPVMMLSEGSAPEHHLQAFDVTYAWNTYNVLDLLLRGKRPASFLGSLLDAETAHFPSGSMRMRFVTNHDKNAWDAPAVVKFGREGLKLGAVLMNALPGIPLLYTGEEVANDRRLSLFDRVPVAWSGAREMGDLYASLFRLRKDHPCLARGRMERIDTSNDRDVFAFLRHAGADRLLIVLNFRDSPRSVEVRLPVDEAHRGRDAGSLSFTDMFPEEGTRLEAGDSTPLRVELKGTGFGIYTVRDVSARAQISGGFIP